MPVNEQWFSFDPPTGSRFEEDAEEKDWFAACSEIVLRDLALSNYYLVSGESMMNVCAYGTGADYVGWDDAENRPWPRATRSLSA